MDEVIDSLNEIISSSAMQDTQAGRHMRSQDEDDDRKREDVGSSVIDIMTSSSSTPARSGGSGGNGDRSDLPSFHYFISEQAKSMLALQELQNEVGALLEFRDLVMEAFPQLRKMPQTVMSPTSNKWEPGIRVKRKLGQQLRDQECLVSSLVPRYRSNSQGKASSRSGEASGSVTSSAIQDSGFCTESNKDHSSAISSSRSKSRETDDELFSLLDIIHSKGTRLKLEVEYLWNRLNRKTTTTSNTISSSLTTSKRRCKSLDDLICKNTNTNNCTAADYTFDCSLRSHFLDSELDDLKHERDLLLKKLTDIESEHFANLAQTNRLLAELENVSAEKRDLEERLRVAISTENELQQRQHHNQQDTRLSGGDESATQQHRAFFERNQPSRNAQTPFAKCQLLKLVQFFKENQSSTAADQQQHQQLTSTTSSQREPYFTTPSEQSNLSFDTTTTVSVAGTKLDRPTNPLTKELSSVDGKEASTRIDLREEFDKRRRCRSRSECPCDDCKANDQTGSDSVATAKTAAIVRQSSTSSATSAIDQCISSIGKPDILIGFLSGHSSFSEVPKITSNVSLSKEKVLGILNEFNPVELHRYLLTLSYQIEALNVHVQRISKSRLNIFQQLNRFKIENEDLRFQLEEKNIQLEGTKAKVRVLERMRNEKFCYSASDLMSSSGKPNTSHQESNDMFTCPVSDTALLQQSSNQMLTSSKHSEKCQDLRDHSDNRTKPLSAGPPSTSKRIISKIPLKTNSSKIPTKLASCGSSSAKKLTSFRDCKEYSSPGPPTNSSCVSSNASSLNK
ncbi:uncharacterized protein jvl [Planococcus citri]|uniref:uncharacterized protein jvl n=1 Tax=Planococcus citri TaxID=170843 RepID=UPI0031F728F7